MSLVQQGRSAVGFLSNNRQKLAGLTSAMLGVLVRKGKQAMKQQAAYKSARGLEISSQNSRTSSMARAAQPRFKRGARARKPRKSGKSKASSDPERTAVSVGKLKRKSGGAARVKVSKKFKAAVKQIIENAPHPGVYETLNSGYIQAVSTGTQGLQTVGYIATFPSGTNMFSPVMGLHAASRLYNSKAPLPAATSNPGLGDSNNFNGQNFEMNVLSNVGVFKIKSNSHRAYSLTFYICTPKMQQNVEAPVGCWEAALDQEAIAGILPDSYNNGFGTAGGAVKVNKLYQDPRMCPQFNRYFKVETKKVMLHPGEFTQFNVPLFKGKLQFEKFFLDGTFQAVQKECTYMFYTCYTDLVLNNAAINASVRTNENVAHAICWELQTKMKISIPEQAGFTYSGTTTSGTRQPLNARIAKRIYDHYYPLSSNGTTLIAEALTTKTRIDPVQPATDEGTG